MQVSGVVPLFGYEQSTCELAAACGIGLPPAVADVGPEGLRPDVTSQAVAGARFVICHPHPAPQSLWLNGTKRTGITSVLLT